MAAGEGARRPKPGTRRETPDEERLAAFWEKRFTLAKEQRRPFLRERQRVLRYVRGRNVWTAEDKKAWEGTRVVVPYLYSTQKAMTPALMYKEPRVLALPKRMGGRIGEPQAKVMGSFLDYVWREQYMKRKAKRAVHEALYGLGIMRSDWDPIRQMPTAVHVKPNRILIDPDIEDDIAEAGWIAECVPMKLADVRAKKEFHRREEVKAEHAKSQFKDEDGSASEKNEDFATVNVWYIWSKRGVGKPEARGGDPKESPAGDNRLLVWAEGTKFFLSEGDWPFVLDYDEFPYSFLAFEYDPDTVWGYGPFSPAVPLQQNLNWLATFRLAHVKKAAVTKVMADEEGVPAEGLEALKSGKDLDIVKVHMAAVPGMAPVQGLTFPQTPSDVDATFDRAKLAVDELLGTPDFVRGVTTRTKSATEAHALDQRADNKTAEKADAVNDFVNDVNRKLLMIALQFVKAMSEYAPDGRVVRKGIDYFLGPQAAPFWPEDLPVEEILDEVNLEIEAGSLRRPSPEQQIEHVLQFWNFASPLYIQFGLFPQLLELMRRIATLFEFSNIEALVPQELQPPVMQPTPEQQAQEQQAMQEQQVMQQTMQMVPQMGQQMQALMQAHQKAMMAIQQLQSAIPQVRQEGQFALQQAMQALQIGMESKPQVPGTVINAQQVGVESQQTVVQSQLSEVQTGSVGVQTPGVTIAAADVAVPPPQAVPVETVMIFEPERDPVTGRIKRAVVRAIPAVPEVRQEGMEA